MFACLYCIILFFIAYFCFIGKIPFTEFNKRKFCCQQFFAGHHCCSFQFVIIQDRNFNAVGKHQLRTWWAGAWAGPAPGGGQPSPTPPSRWSVHWLVTCGLLYVSSGEHFEFCFEAGAPIKDRLMIKRHEVILWSSSGKPWPGSQETLPSHHLICFSPLWGWVRQSQWFLLVLKFSGSLVS